MSHRPLFVPRNRILCIEGDFQALLDYLARGEWRRGTQEQIALHPAFDGGWYLYRLEIFRERADEFLRLPEPQQTRKYFDDFFEIHAAHQAAHVSRKNRVTAPAIAWSEDGVMAGAWVHALAGRERPQASAPTRGSSDEADEALLRRTPHMDFSPLPPAAPGSEFRVEVFADDAPPAADEDSQPIALPDGKDEYDLEVWLAGSAELEVRGGAVHPLRLDRRQPRSASALFDVKVRAEAAEGTLAALTASFSCQGRPCGRVTRTVLIGQAGAAPPATGGAPRRQDYSGSVRLEAEPPPPPDLTIVVACPDSEADRYVVQVVSPLLEAYRVGVTRPWKLRQDAGKLVRKMMENFTRPGISNRRQRLDNLVGAGRELFGVAPAHFQEAFWEIIRRGLPLRTIYIVSEEPHIPWELMVPDPGLAEDTGRQWKPLGVEFAVGRWVHAGHLSPPASASVTHSCIMAPDYTGSEQQVLAGAVAESDYLRDHLGGVPFAPMIYSEISERIAEEMAPLLHFVGHGSVTGDPADERFALEDNGSLSATEARGMEGLRRGLRRQRPMVFLNACEVGRQTPALVGAGGFPSTFAQLGASAVIAPLWSVRDDCAHQVAAALYDALRQDAASGGPVRPVAEILRGIRRRAYEGDDAGEDSFAAYCFYGDPAFVLRLPAP